MASSGFPRSRAMVLLVLCILFNLSAVCATLHGSRGRDQWHKRDTLSPSAGASTSTSTAASTSGGASSTTALVSSTASVSTSAASPTATLNATASSELDTILERRVDFAIRSASNANSIETWLDSLSADGTWPDVDYTAGCPAQRANWPAEKHWSRIVTLTAVWHGGLANASQWVGSEEVEEGFLKAMDYWFDNDFNNTDCLVYGGNASLTCTCDTPGLWNTNWYASVIGVPTYVGQACVLANSTLDAAQLAKCDQMLGRSFNEFYDVGFPLDHSGANALLLAAISVDYALMTKNLTVLEVTYDQVDAQLVLVPEVMVDGIKPDGSFGQHYGLLYTGNYGKDFANNVLALEIEAAGTAYAADQSEVEAFETFWDGSQWMVIYNTLTKVSHWDLSVLGRIISFPVSDKQANSALLVNLTALASLGELWGSSVIENVAHSLQENVTTTNAGDLVGNRVFWDNDYVVQRGSNYVSTLKMYSDRTLNSECNNTENPFGFHLADFTLYTYVNGDEYEDVVGGWDWNLIPGTTVDYGNTPLNCAQTQWAGLERMVGGVTTGTVGIGLQKYTNPLTRDFSWQKAIFFLPDDSQVIMVSDITSLSNASVLSVLDQRRRLADVYVDGEKLDTAAGPQNFTNVTSLWHGNNGYVFDKDMPATLSVSVEERAANWTELGISLVQSTVDMFTAYLEHTDLDKSLQYMLFPGIDYESFKSKSAERNVVIVANDGEVAAVYDEDNGIIAGVFWSVAGASVSYGNHTLSANGNVAVVVDACAGTLTADPTQSLADVELVFDGQSYTVNLPTDPSAVGSSVTQDL